MNLRKFVYLFIAVNLQQGYDYIDLDYFKEFLCSTFNLEYIILDNELKTIINEMIDDNYVTISNSFPYLIKIDDSFPYKDILLNNNDYNILVHLKEYILYTFDEKKDVHVNDGQIKVFCK